MSRVLQLRLDWLTVAAEVMGPGATPVSAKGLVEELILHSDR